VVVGAFISLLTRDLSIADKSRQGQGEKHSGSCSSGFDHPGCAVIAGGVQRRSSPRAVPSRTVYLGHDAWAGNIQWPRT
jgi:hypothetical protein